MKVQIVHPALAHYRVAFFKGLAANELVKIYVTSSPVSPEGVTSAHIVDEFVDLAHPWIQVAPGLFWQKGVRLRPELSAGDVLVVTGNPRLLSNFPLIACAKARKVGVIWWGHGWTPSSSAIRNFVRLGLMRIADAVLVYTEREMRYLTDRGIHSERLVSLNNGLDTDEIDEAIRDWPRSRLDRFLREEDLVGRSTVLFSGRLTKKARVDLLLEALALVRARHPDVLLVILGDGPQRSELLRRSESLGLGGHTRWLGSLYDQRSIAPWFLSGQCFVYPGSVGLSLIHALSYGLAAIVHDNPRGHMPEFDAMVPGHTGLLFQENSHADLASKICEFLSQPERRAAMAKFAFERARASFSANGMRSRFTLAIAIASERAMSREHA